MTTKAPQLSRRATSYDVAVAAGVAQSTVSRCFQADSNISEGTRAHVRAVAEKLGYTPNALARSLITRRSQTVGVIITRYTLRNSPNLLYSLSEALGEVKQRLILLAVEDDESAHSILDSALEYPLDGLISCANMRAQDVKRFVDHHVPVLFFNRHPPAGRVDCISTDQLRGAGDMAAALVQAGYRNFLCVGGPEHAPVSQERTRGFNQQLRREGIPPAEVLATDFSYDRGRTVFLEAMRAGARPDCVFCANDQLAFGVIDACRYELGLRVPEDIAVAGFDDIPEAERPSYSLTTVRQPTTHMARQAIQLLVQRIAHPSRSAQHTAIRGELVSRASAPIAR